MFCDFLSTLLSESRLIGNRRNRSACRKSDAVPFPVETFGVIEAVPAALFLILFAVGPGFAASPLWPFRLPALKSTPSETVREEPAFLSESALTPESGTSSEGEGPRETSLWASRSFSASSSSLSEWTSSDRGGDSAPGPLSFPPVSDVPSATTETSEPSDGPIFLPYHEVLGRVVCQSDFPLDDMEIIRTEIRNLQKDLIDYLGVPEPKEKIEICVFRERESYVAFLKTNCPQAPLNRPALYVKDQGPGYVFLQLDEKLILNLRHEMTHAFLNSTLKNVPIWLDEGLAKYFETPAGERGKANPFLLPVADRAESVFIPVPSLPSLEKLNGIGDMGPVQYRNAWAWTHFLIHYSPETQRILGLYLQTLRPENQDGIDPRQAAEIQKSAPLTTLLKSEIPDYKKQYRNHFTDWARR